MRGLASLIAVVVGGVLLFAAGDSRAADPVADVPIGAELDGVPRAWSIADEEAVRSAVLDYVEGIYDVQPERIERSVHPSLRKIGYERHPDGSWASSPMTFAQLRVLAERWNADGHLPPDAPKVIDVLDVLDQTASAKLVAAWGVDYFHLARVEGRWQIMNVLWQTPPSDD